MKPRQGGHAVPTSETPPHQPAVAAVCDRYKVCMMPDQSVLANPTTTELLARLVAFDTTSRNSNLALIGFIRGFLDRHDVAYRVSTNPTGGKANIHAIIGPQEPGGIALSGHVDTVPVDGQAWSTDPFALRGRGRTAVRARRLRHEGLRRRLPVRGARHCGRAGFPAAASVHHL